MDDVDPVTVRETILADAADLLAGVERRWGDLHRLDSVTVDPLPGDDDSFPASADRFYEQFYPYAAGAVVTDEAGRLLCVDSEARGEWETPGGAGEPGERPAETARRETREETGIECELTDVLFVRRMEVDLGRSETLPIPVVAFTARRTGGVELDADALDDHEEVADVRWFEPAAVPTDLREYETIRAHLDTLDGAGSAR
ncbi:NUDIX hydrolase [Halomicrococcus sp. SG-WS-1]|uniref:NUDIX hydrolase n=1 Tax=Halomicrococcus sp. SG-WS-1 TaxID=3439057 RepID=UPI003F7A88AA